jgi:hypothetical protein
MSYSVNYRWSGGRWYKYSRKFKTLEGAFKCGLRLTARGLSAWTITQWEQS